MSCIYKYKGQNYTESEFRDLVRNTIVKSTKQGYTTIRFPKGENGHYPDDFKKPWHITYPSGKWIEPSLLEQQWTGNNQPIFVPSTHNYRYYTPEDYFNYPHDKTLTQKFIPTGWNRHLTF